MTAQHIFKLVTMGAYTSNHIFRCAQHNNNTVQHYLSTARNDPPIQTAHSCCLVVVGLQVAYLSCLSAPLLFAAAAADHMCVSQSHTTTSFCIVLNCLCARFALCLLSLNSPNPVNRVDKGFVAQVADVIGGRQVKLNKAQQAEAELKVPLEVKTDVKHTEGACVYGRGMQSGRWRV